ncbi:MAG: hypothetical protein NC102_07380 [Clostridium sp.]|nr:hypothetical protein [Clostridium sp.]
MILTKQTNIDDPQQAPGIVDLSEGVGSENYCKDKEGKMLDNDPLNNAQQFANKPASSIPTIFARALFFNSALLNIINIDSRKITTYSKSVSQWLDLLEMIFRKGDRLKYVKWNVDTQTEKLKSNRNGNPRLAHLAEALKVHMDTYLQGTDNIYLIFDENGQLMGGTSPFTFVYTAPNYNSGQPVLSLLERKEDFQNFMIRLYVALKRAGVIKDPKTKDQFSGLRTYMEAVLNRVKNRFNPQSLSISPEYSYQSFLNSYTKLTVNKEEISIATLKDIELYLFMRKEGELVSDFYINSNVQDLNAIDTPLVLPLTANSYKVKYLHDEVRLNESMQIPQIEGIPYDKKRELPDNSGIRHPWITEIDFLEDKLIQLPYIVDTTKFYGAINVPSTTPDGPSVSYLLPIKPLLLRFFTVDRLKELIQFRIVDKDENKGMIEITLRIPIKNLNGDSTGDVIFRKLYNPYTSLYDTAAPESGKKDAISVGISPFVRFAEANQGLNGNGNTAPAPISDKYNVLLQASNLDDQSQDITLGFYTVGNGELTGLDANGVERFTENKGSLRHKAYFYDVMKGFEGLQVRVMDNGRQVGGAMIFPIWEKGPKSGSRSFKYSIDFGTTNTHVAFVSYVSSDNKVIDPKTEQSFKTEELKAQAQYLAATPVQALKPGHSSTNQLNKAMVDLSKFMDHIYGCGTNVEGRKTLNDQARLFYPTFVDKEYSFPIRTVVSRSFDEIKESAKVFDNLSIGFHFSKEYSKAESGKYNYNDELKWQFEESVGAGPAKTTARLFFTQILMMVRNHWIQQEDVNLKTPPKFIITYPLAMSNVTGMINVWKEAFKTVFDQEAERDTFDTVAESLAPAYKMIKDGARQSAGILNVDIGGGTTDLQYYANYGGKIVSRYDSVRFAGDDLWGGGYENVKRTGLGQVPQDNNVFTRFADSKFSNQTIIKLNEGEITQYGNIDYTGKEKINFLLKDSGHALFDALNADKDSEAFKVLQLHYAALIYHIANWIKADQGGMAEKFPRKINFTGFGSMYIPILFGLDGNRKLTEYTANLFKAFGIDNIPEGFSVEFSENPKDVTAEGAALYSIEKIKRDDYPKQLRHLGFDGYASGNRITWEDLGDKEFEEKVFKYFDDFVDKFQKVETSHPLPATLSKRLKSHARDSFQEMSNINRPIGDGANQSQIKDSLFFWMLKGSLFDLDQA